MEIPYNILLLNEIHPNGFEEAGLADR